MNEDKKADDRLSKVQKLLRAGHTQAFIKKILGLNRYQLDKLKDQLAIANIKCRTRVSKLCVHDSLIKRWLALGQDTRMIQFKLAAMRQPVHYTTLRNYIRSINRATPEGLPTHLPGDMAYVSVLEIKQSKGAYIFCLLLGYSHFSYFSVLPKPELSHFLRCHMSCFRKLGGVPKCIQLCEVSCLCLSGKDNKEYQMFLTFYGSRRVKGLQPLAKSKFCVHQSERVKKDILSTFFHGDVKRLAAALKSKHADVFNLKIHPRTKRQIRKEFELEERPKLLPLPEAIFPVPMTVTRTVNKKGLVFYQYNLYQMPPGYEHKTVQVTKKGRHLLFSMDGRQIARYSV